MDAPQSVLVRGRCACGKRYRIRNAQPGLTVVCPRCSRSITITHADLRAASADARLIPLQPDTLEEKEAILIDHGELRLAPRGSRPGLTGAIAYDHDEALLMSALAGRGLGTPSVRTTAAGEVYWEPTELRRGFVDDLLVSFYFAGIRNNAWNILASAAACSVLLLVSLLLPGPFQLLTIIPLILLALYVVQFYWSVLGQTAGGEDEIPWVQSDWDLWDDAFKPLFWLVAISVLCSVPSWCVTAFVPSSYPGKELMGWAALLAGWFFWPVAVMSVALGNTLLFVRPDWLVRCVLGIGPVYVIAWVLVAITLAGWVAFFYYQAVLLFVPVVGPAIVLYLGYVLFRMLGVLFRHFRHRFPWRY